MNAIMTYHELSLIRRFRWRTRAALETLRRFRASDRSPAVDFDIVVTTFDARFDSFFKSLLTQLHLLFADRTIIVAANGNADAEAHRLYRDRLEKLAGKFPNVKLVVFDQPEGLTRMWNDALRVSSASASLVLNDDLYLTPGFRREMEASGLMNHAVAKINQSWSHFWIRHQVLEQVGWFDQGFTQIGYEDVDYEVRLAFENLPMPNVDLFGVLNGTHQPETTSYGDSFEVADGKYSGANQAYFHEKWDVTPQPSPGSIYVAAAEGWVAPKNAERAN